MTGGPSSDKTTIQEMVVRNNFYKNVVKGPWLKLGNLCAAAFTTGSVIVTSGVMTDGIGSHDLIEARTIK